MFPALCGFVDDIMKIKDILMVKNQWLELQKKDQYAEILQGLKDLTLEEFEYEGADIETRS